ncbi:hypothetical protein N2152v2_005709 [Parachlorella kessleri]
MQGHTSRTSVSGAANEAPVGGGGGLGAGCVVGAACCGAAMLVGYALWRRQSGGGSAGSSRGHSGGAVSDQGRRGSAGASSRPKDSQQVWLGRRSCPNEELSSLRAELSTTMQSLVATQGALLELHKKRSSDRDESSKEIAGLKADLSSATHDLRAAQDSLRATSSQASTDAEAGSKVGDTPRSQSASAGTEAGGSQGPLAMQMADSGGVGNGGGTTGGSVDVGSAVLTSSSGSGSLAPALGDESAEMARSMFAHSAGPQWEDVVVSKDAIELCSDSNGQLMKLGEGYSGNVYRARVHGSTLCACKVFQLDSVTSMAHRHKFFIDECRLLWRIAHPNVVTFYGACVSEGQGYLLMELMASGLAAQNSKCLVSKCAEGQGYLLMELMASDLGAALHSRPERREDRSYAWAKKGARVALQIAAGLSYLHQHRIVHLDLKPKNVLLARDGTAKLADVGFSRVMKSGVLSNLGDRLGTFDYCAPEVLLGQAASEKADIYSFGVLLWEICAGEVPSRGKTRPLRAPQECPEEVHDLQLECVRLSPWDRPSAAQIVRAFHSLRRANALTASAPLPAAAGSGGEASAAAAAATCPLPSMVTYGDRGMEQQAPAWPAAAGAPFATPFATPFPGDQVEQAQQQGRQQQQQEEEEQGRPSVGEAMPAGPHQFLPLPMLPGPSMTLDSPFKNAGLPIKRACMNDSAERASGKMAILMKEHGH